MLPPRRAWLRVWLLLECEYALTMDPVKFRDFNWLPCQSAPGPPAVSQADRWTSPQSISPAGELLTWLDHDYPAIVKRAKKEKAEIHWADETGISNQANYGRSFAPQGETPVIPRPAARFTQSMISSLTNQGKLRFMVYDGALNTAIFLKFLRRLVKDADRKLFVIVDNLRVHKAKVVTAWVAENTDRIELVYLPPYAPERNPDEYLNNDVKQALGRRSTPMDKVAMKAGLRSHMQGLQRRPTKVRSFFQAPDVRYAA